MGNKDYSQIYERAKTFSMLAYNFGELIIDSGMKQTEVAKALGTRPQYVNAVIMGRRPFPIEWVTLVCKLFGCSPNNLFGWEKRFVPTDSEHTESTSKWIMDLPHTERKETLTMGE